MSLQKLYSKERGKEHLREKKGKKGNRRDKKGKGVQQDVARHGIPYVYVYIYIYTCIDTHTYIVYVQVQVKVEGVYIIVWCPKMAYAQTCVYSINLDIWLVILSPIDGTQIPNI